LKWLSYASVGVLTGILAKVAEEVMAGWKKDMEPIEERNLYCGERTSTLLESISTVWR
jgi:hypothetical protein